MVTVTFKQIALPHTPPGKNDRLEAEAYDHGLLLEGNLAKAQKEKQKSQIDLEALKIK